MKNLNAPNQQQQTTHTYQAKRLPFRPRLDGISDRALKNHHGKLYSGYVDKKNEIQDRLEELGRTIAAGDGSAENSTYSELRSLKGK